MITPQDVLRRMIADAPPGRPWSIPKHACWYWASKEDRHGPMEQFEAQSALIALAPVLAQHLAEALDLLGCPNTTTIPCQPGGCKVHDLLASVERDLTHPDAAPDGETA